VQGSGWGGRGSRAEQESGTSTLHAGQRKDRRAWERRLGRKATDERHCQEARAASLGVGRLERACICKRKQNKTCKLTRSTGLTRTHAASVGSAGSGRAGVARNDTSGAGWHGWRRASGNVRTEQRPGYAATDWTPSHTYIPAEGPRIAGQVRKTCGVDSEAAEANLNARRQCRVGETGAGRGGTRRH